MAGCLLRRKKELMRPLKERPRPRQEDSNRGLFGRDLSREGRCLPRLYTIVLAQKLQGPIVGLAAIELIQSFAE
jgi:hypothetical protein